MGVVQKQSIRNAFITYSGILIGALNTMFIFPKVLGAEKHGLVMLLLSIATVFTQFLHLGVPNVLIRYFPYFKLHKKYVYRMMIQIPLITILLFAFFLHLFGDYLFNSYKLKSSLFEEYQVFILPLVASLVVFEVFVALSRSELKTVYPSFLREFALRLMTLILLVVYALQRIDFEQFMLFWLGAYALNSLLMLGFLLRSKLFRFSLGLPLVHDSSIGKEMVGYGLITLLTVSATILVNRIDVLMLGYYLDIENVAFYSIALFMATLVQIPGRSIMQIGKPILAKAWERNDTDEIQNLYHKSALNQMLIGSLVFIGIWLNIDDVLSLVPEKYQGVQYVFFFIGIAKLFDTSCGLNGAILVTSEKYKYDLVINVILILLTLATNAIFIPMYGIEGAALATAISVIIYNVLKWSLLKYWFGFQPFTPKFVLGVGISLFTLIVISYIPVNFESVLLRIIVKTSIICVIYAVFVVGLNVSEDITNGFYKIKRKVGL